MGHYRRKGLHHGYGCPYVRIQLSLRTGEQEVVIINNMTNLTSKGKGARFISGLLLIIATGYTLHWMVSSSRPVLWRFGLFPFWWLGILNLLSFQKGICLICAVQGKRETENGFEEIQDICLVQDMKGHAKKMAFHSLMAAVLVTLTTLAL